MSNEIDSIVCEILDTIGGYWDDEVGTPRKSIKYGDLIKLYMEKASAFFLKGLISVAEPKYTKYWSK